LGDGFEIDRFADTLAVEPKMRKATHQLTFRIPESLNPVELILMPMFLGSELAIGKLPLVAMKLAIYKGVGFR
jgi:hypothetical protein